ncbi:hypothetical protein [Streptomyces sp. NPDC056921]|uniref:hypothetical protein n=1 Tax=Streptomyces sp. NPDC056921 TaxID=3345966 RepID=UPI0036282D9C
MLRRICVAAAAAGVLLGVTVPAHAADSDRPARTVAWAAAYGTASAGGERWTEPGGTGFSTDLVVLGKLSNTGEGCYSLWTRFTFDLAPGLVRKQAEVCGPGTVDVDLRQRYQLTTTGSLTVCRGTENAEDCAPWQSITSWPISRY